MAKLLKDYLDKEDISKGTRKRLKKYKNLGFLEHFAMYMGVAQLLEIALKQILFDKFEYNLEKTEKWTLGRVVRELKEKGLREDIFVFLDPVVTDRNYIAHDLLASHLIFNMISKPKKRIYTKEIRRLTRAAYELEQVFFLIEFTNQNNGW